MNSNPPKPADTISVFDNHAKTYKSDICAALGPLSGKYSWALRRKVQIVEKLLVQHIVPESGRSKVLDVGCGIGLMHAMFSTKVDVTGIDVSQASLDVANDALEATSHADGGSKCERSYRLYDGRTIPYADRTFDVVFASCVFHHLHKTQHLELLKEMLRVTKRGGIILIFEHNPLHPITQLIFRTNEFDKGENMISHWQLRSTIREASGKEPTTRGLLYTPFESKIFQRLETLLERIIASAQYYCFVEK